MKIIYVSPGCFDKGGISRYNRYQIQVLQEQYGKENIKVLSLLGPDEHSFEGEYQVEWNGNGVSLKDKWGLIKNLFRLAWSFKPDCIWIGHVNLSGLGKWVAKTCNATTVLNAYGLEIWSKMRKDAAWGLRNVDAIAADCHNTADYLVNKGIRKREDIEVVWDCIDINRFVPADRVPATVLEKYSIPDPSKYFIVLSLGRLAKPDAYYKGYDRLLAAVEKLVPEFPQLRLVFAGRGNYRQELEAMLKDKKMEHVVSFTGSVDEEHLVNVYQSCHLFSLVTEAGEGKGEGIPLTPLEAMACGKPILVGNQDGSREAVIDNRNGFVLDPKDLDAQVNCIRKYLTDAAFLKTQSDAALNTARNYFSYDRFKKETLGFIQNHIEH